MIKWIICQQMFWWAFHFIKHFGQSLPVHDSMGWPLKEDKLTRGLSFSSLPFPFHERWLQRVGCFLWALTRNLALSIHKSALTFVDFSVHSLTVWIRNMTRSVSAREIIVSSDPWSEPEMAKMSFFLKSHWKRWLLDTLKRQPTWH